MNRLETLQSGFITGIDVALSSEYMGTVVIGHQGVDTIGITCDYDETSFPLSLSNKNILIKSGFNSVSTLTVSGQCIITMNANSILNEIATTGVTGIQFNLSDNNTTINQLTLGVTIGQWNPIYNFHSTNTNLVISVTGSFWTFYNANIKEIKTLNGSPTFVNSYIANLKDCNNDLILVDSQVGDQNTLSISQGLYNSITGIIKLINSDLVSLCVLTATNKITSNNSTFRNINDIGSILSFTDKSDITIYPLRFSLFGGANICNITFGDGTAPNDFTTCEIKIILMANTALAGYDYLILNDNPNGVGTTYKNNVFEILFGEQATFNISGGATNILKRTGMTLGITDTLNTYTIFNTNY